MCLLKAQLLEDELGRAQMISAFSIPFHRLFLSVLSAFQNQFFSPSSVLTLPCSTLFRSMSLSSVSPTVSVVLSVYSPYFLFSLWHCTTNTNLSPLYSNNRSTVPPRPKICMRGRGRYAQEGSTNAKGDRSPRLRFPQPSRQQARGPARARGGAQAQPHPRRHRSRDPGLILSW